MALSRLKVLGPELARFLWPILFTVIASILANITTRYHWPFNSDEDLKAWGVTILIVITSIAYLWIARLVPRLLVVRAHELYGSILVYVAIALLLILQCGAFGWSAYDLVVATDVKAEAVTRGDALYFSAATFTTLGYGDFVPRAGAGRLLATFEALLGTAHSVLFILVFLYGGNVTVEPTLREKRG